MITLDDILCATCEVFEIQKGSAASKKRIDERHQVARVVYCVVSTGQNFRFTYSEIGRKINRTKQQVCHNIKMSNTLNKHYEQAAQEVKSRLLR